ncbi:putative nucleolar complex protein 14 [Beauveria bassiana]|nr:putative nucleolar complex protein 14 [Beauveria bassiana]
MAGSQLKRLKASLREQGVIGPQKSKKQKRRDAEEQKGRNEKRLQRGAVLSGIREQFNPFDLKHAARGPKFDVTSNVPKSASAAKGIQGRPGAARAAGEERRRETLLVDMQHRNKVGGILDRRFGENDPTMAPEDKMLERFAHEKQRAHKKSSMFDLEDDGPLDGGLTHGGKSLSFDDDDSLVDDFEEDLDANDSDGSVRERQRLKRLRGLAGEDHSDTSDKEPERKKSKKEVMEEIIAKSKQHKYERQAAKEGDDEMRATIDKELPNIQMLLSSSARNKRSEEAEAATIAGFERGEFDRNFDMQTSLLGKGDEHGLPFTFPCPETVDALQAITSQYPHESTPKIVQRVRALYHPKLDAKNKERLGNFSKALVDYIASPWDPATAPPPSVTESIVRHIHSLAKMFPIEISNHFRHHLKEIGEQRTLSLEPSDLLLLSAIGSIFPTSDHFHQVVTPAMLTIGRYLGQKVPKQLADFATGTFLCILSLQYQQLAKRYVPEVINFTINTLCALAPIAPSTQITTTIPIHEYPQKRFVSAAATIRRLRFTDCIPGDAGDSVPASEAAIVSAAILATTLQVLDAAADLWTGKSAFIETFAPALCASKHLLSKSCRSKLPSSIAQQAEKLATKLERMSRLAHIARRPLELHHHRRLAIKSFIPKFEETFDPSKHYDHDRERAELAKLQKEHKRERKGAMRELRKDANFMAREKLRTKIAKDEAYEKKFKRLVSEIQSEEGRESNVYEREKSARKRANNR